jgi:predicted permease
MHFYLHPQLTTFLVLRATLAPALMALIARLSGFHGDMAVALVILSILPVAQTAFVICKQYETGTHAITAAMVASLLLMLPQLVGTLALLERWGAFL